MFSSNQVLELSGRMSQLETALEFALSYSDHIKDMTESERKRGCKLLYQIVGKKYCIGWGFERVPEGWLEYPFDFEVPIVAQIIRQHLSKHDKEAVNAGMFDWCDGSQADGFLMKEAAKSFSEEGCDAKSPFYGIVTFEPFELFYAK